MSLDEMEIFYFVAIYKSFSKAAKKLHVSKSYISKKITKLEQSINVNLIARNTRTLSLTKIGEEFYKYCAKIVNEKNEAQALISERKGKPSGILKISVPTASGLYLVAPFLPIFIKKYPEIILDVELENRLVDVIEEGYDLVLRAGESLKSSNLYAQRIYTIKSIMCATKAYFKKYGKPQVPGDLTNHNCAYVSYANNDTIYFNKDAKCESKNLQGNFTSNQLTLIKNIVMNDICIAVFPEFMIKNEIESGALIPCLSNYQLNQSTLYAVYPIKKFMPPKVKYFIDELKKYLNDIDQ